MTTRRKFRRLNREQKQIGRQISANAWVVSQGNYETAVRIFKADHRLVGLDPATIVLLLQLAWLLWKYWHAKKITEPESVASELEPVEWD
jgi:hypothetical protein